SYDSTCAASSSDKMRAQPNVERETPRRSANGSDESLRFLLWLRLGTLFLYVLFHVVLGDFPGLVGVVLVHALERLQRVGSKIFFIHDTEIGRASCREKVENSGGVVRCKDKK